MTLAIWTVTASNFNPILKWRANSTFAVVTYTAEEAIAAVRAALADKTEVQVHSCVRTTGQTVRVLMPKEASDGN